MVICFYTGFYDLFDIFVYIYSSNLWVVKWRSLSWSKKHAYVVSLIIVHVITNAMPYVEHLPAGFLLLYIPELCTYGTTSHRLVAFGYSLFFSFFFNTALHVCQCNMLMLQHFFYSATFLCHRWNIYYRGSLSFENVIMLVLTKTFLNYFRPRQSLLKSLTCQVLDVNAFLCVNLLFKLTFFLARFFW